MEDPIKPRYKKKLKQSQKGVQGFVSIPEHERARNIVTFKVTDDLRDTLKQYAYENDLSKSEVIKDALEMFFKEKGVSKPPRKRRNL